MKVPDDMDEHVPDIVFLHPVPILDPAPVTRFRLPPPMEDSDPPEVLDKPDCTEEQSPVAKFP